MKTYSAKLADIKNDWHVIDAQGVVLGRLAAIIATKIRGKHKAMYTPNMDCGDNVVVINADKVKFNGKNKLDNSKFVWHTGYPGGLKHRTWRDILHGKFPERLLIKAVERMISKGPLRCRQMKRLFVYSSSDHPHHAQAPQNLDVAAMNSKNKR